VLRRALSWLRRNLGWPSLLLISCVMAHYGYDLIASFYPPSSQLRAGKAWHSVLRAVPETMILYLAVWVLMPWRPIGLRLATGLVCAWGIIESWQIAACRLQYPMDQPPPDTQLYTGLCDAVTGWPIYMLTLTAVLMLATLSVRRRGNKNGNTDSGP